MGEISNRLLAAQDAMLPLEEIIVLGLALLADSTGVARDVVNPAERLSEATRAFRSLEIHCRNAFRRYPSSYRGDDQPRQPDDRALVLFDTLSAIKNGGMYAPPELAKAAMNGSTADWVAREAIRLGAFTVIAQSAIRALQGGTLTPAEYHAVMNHLVRQFARAAIATG